MLQESQMTIFDIIRTKPTSSQEDSLVKHSVSQENEQGLKILEEHCSLKLQGRLKKSNHLMYYWKMSKGYSVTMEGEHSEQSFKRWMYWGLSQNGVCLTLNTGEFHRTENVCIS